MTEGFDMGGLLEQAQKMAEQMQASQAELADTEFEGAAGGGVVRVTLTGDYECVNVSIDPAAIDPDDVGMLEDLVKAALLDATSKVGISAGGGLDLGGIDLGGMLGPLLGSDEDEAGPVAIDIPADDVEDGED
jgi:DNA-binding YbaB/EbfC family protein